MVVGGCSMPPLLGSKIFLRASDFPPISDVNRIVPSSVNMAVILGMGNPLLDISAEVGQDHSKRSFRWFVFQKVFFFSAWQIGCKHVCKGGKFLEWLNNLNIFSSCCSWIHIYNWLTSESQNPTFLKLETKGLRKVIQYMLYTLPSCLEDMPTRFLFGMGSIFTKQTCCERWGSSNFLNSEKLLFVAGSWKIVHSSEMHHVKDGKEEM